MSDPAAVPEGYEVLQRTQGPGFGGLVGPFYARREGRAISLGLRIEPRHLNSRTAAATGHLLVEGRPAARISANFRLARTRAPLPAGPEKI